MREAAVRALRHVGHVERPEGLPRLQVVSDEQVVARDVGAESRSTAVSPLYLSQATVPMWTRVLLVIPGNSMVSRIQCLYGS